jgi:hypothetical protein
MLHDLDASISNLLTSQLTTIYGSPVAISFAAPDSNFQASVSQATVDVFLYDVRENLELRASDVMARQYNNGNGGASKILLTKPPVNVNVSYIITAWCTKIDTSPDIDEHHLLGAVLQALLLYPTLPNDILVNSLKDITPLPRTLVMQPSYLSNIGEFWSAMSGRPKAMIHYTVTLPIYPFAPINTTQVKQYTTSVLPLDITRTNLIGRIVDANSQELIAGSTVTLTSSTIAGLTLTMAAVSGNFYFTGLDGGVYQINVTPPTGYATPTTTLITLTNPKPGGEFIQSVTITLTENS